jgi:hypothetical protein
MVEAEDNIKTKVSWSERSSHAIMMAVWMFVIAPTMTMIGRGSEALFSVKSSIKTDRVLIPSIPELATGFTELFMGFVVFVIFMHPKRVSGFSISLLLSSSWQFVAFFIARSGEFFDNPPSPWTKSPLCATTFALHLFSLNMIFFIKNGIEKSKPV